MPRAPCPLLQLLHVRGQRVDLFLRQLVLERLHLGVRDAVGDRLHHRRLVVLALPVARGHVGDVVLLLVLRALAVLGMADLALGHVDALGIDGGGLVVGLLGVGLLGVGGLGVARLGVLGLG